jgi:hypothetical protein
MDTLLRFLTSKKTTILSFVFGMCTLLLDDQFVAELQTLGVSTAVSVKLVAASKIVAWTLTLTGFSPLPKPAPKRSAPAPDDIA